jgi:4-aminobutyrate--pyruvate transaminase
MEHRPNSLAARDIASVLHPYTNLKTHPDVGPLVITGGDGVHVQDEDGNRYIEAMAGLWCTSLGFNEPRLVEAAAEAMRKLPFYHSFTGKSHPAAIELAERLLAMAPAPMSKVFFANSGSEANDTAIKLIWYANNALGRPNKKKIISRQRGYHGVTIASASLTHLVNNQRDFDLPLDRFIATDCPHFYRGALTGESEDEFATRLAENLENFILAEGPDTIAAFFAEPVMGAGGVVVPPATYFAKIQKILKKYDIWFVADEVICGFGRTGNMFGCETFNIKPDMIVLAKALSSAYIPISALMISEPIFQALVTESEKIGIFGHGFTYGGHPVACAVAIRTLDIYESDRIVDHVRAVGPVLQTGLRTLAAHPLVGEARGIGLIGALELVKDKPTRTFFDKRGEVGTLCRDFCFQNGLVMRATRDTMIISPPLVITREQIDELAEKAWRCLDLTYARCRDEGRL